MTDASVLINKSLRRISDKLKEGQFELTLDHPFLESIYADLSSAQNQAMVMEGKHVRKCEDCGAVIATGNLLMLPSGRVRVK